MTKLPCDRVLVKVTAKDIKLGKSDQCFLCPIALALNRALIPIYKRHGQHLHAKSAGILPDYVKLLRDDSTAMGVSLSERARNFIARFDSQRPVKPFKFYFSIPRIFWVRPDYRISEKLLAESLEKGSS